MFSFIFNILSTNYIYVRKKGAVLPQKALISICVQSKWNKVDDCNNRCLLLEVIRQILAIIRHLCSRR